MEARPISNSTFLPSGKKSSLQAGEIVHVYSIPAPLPFSSSATSARCVKSANSSGPHIYFNLGLFFVDWFESLLTYLTSSCKDVFLLRCLFPPYFVVCRGVQSQSCVRRCSRGQTLHPPKLRQRSQRGRLCPLSLQRNVSRRENI